MPGPITHVVLTDKIFEKVFKGFDKEKFFVGTSFPDIRYLGTIAREKTHFENTDINEIFQLDPFEAGIRFHSILDRLVNEQFESNGYFSLFEHSPLQYMAAKELMERELYDKTTCWQEIANYFNKVHKEEVDFGVTEDVVKKWHVFLANHFMAKQGDEEIIRSTTVDLGYPLEKSLEVNRIISVAPKEEAVRLINDFYDSFDNLVLGLFSDKKL